MNSTGKSNSAYASKDEILKELHDASTISKQRLIAAAKWVLQHHPALRDEMSPESLLQEAFTAILNSRNWDKNEVNFSGFVTGVMRSIASNETRKIVKTRPDLIYVDDNTELDGATTSVTIEKVLTPEEELLAAEQAANEASKVAIIRMQLSADNEALNIFNLIYEENCPKREIRLRLNMTEKQFWAANNRLFRVAKKLGGTNQ